MKKFQEALSRARLAACRRLVAAKVATGKVLQSPSGQGTTEYAILVGVLVVIAILSITLFRDKIQSLWNEIESAINGLG